MSTLIKKYGNRRLYDTSESRYITLEELSVKVAGGASVQVVDAKSGRDLTQPTLTQIIIERRDLARLLPVPLLEQLIRLGDDALTEFFGRWVSGALEVYLQARQGVQSAASWNPFAALPFSAGDALARLWMSAPFAGSRAPSPPPAGGEPEGGGEQEAREAPAATASSAEVAELRRELEELKRAVAGDAGAKKP